MENFDNIKYERVNYEKTKVKIEDLTKKLKLSNDYKSFIEICKEIINIQNHIEEMCDYADIRNMRDNEDKFYLEEIEFWNEFKPKFDLLFLEFYRIMIDYPNRDKLLEVIPSNFFSTIEYKLKITSEDIVHLQTKESELKNKYRTLSEAKILYDGEERGRAYIAKFFSDKDRTIRKKAHDAVNDYYYSKQSEYDEVLFELINIRNQIAKKLNLDNYVTYSLYSLRRFGYNYDDIRRFRDNVIKYIVPLCKKLSIYHKEELGLEKLEYYDTIFFSESPHSKYVGLDLLNELSKVFKKIDEDLGIFYDEMLTHGYIDLLQRDNKVNFAITNYLSESGLPTITGNFKNNYHDISLATHEFGHSYQKYSASLKDKDYIVSALLKYPTMEIAEMFSHAMELISLDHTDYFFEKDDYKKCFFMQIYDLVSFLPYICLVDEFQERIYTNDNLKIEDIRKTWLELAKKYDLEVENSGHINLKSGGYFYRQSHIFLNPFYYIDYALSYFGSFFLWDKCSDNLDKFREIGSVASYYSFAELINKYGLSSPFEEVNVKYISKKLERQLINLMNDIKYKEENK